MKTKINYYLILALMLIFSFQSFSQEGRFSLNAGIALPMGEFADDNIEKNDNGLAGTGFTLGAKYVYTLNESGLGIFGEGNFMYNGINGDAEDDLEDQFSDDADITFFKYLNFPVLGGLNFTLKANDQISLFGEFGIGADILKVTEFKAEGTITQNGYDYDYEQTLKIKDISTELAFKLGGGIIINDKFTIGLNYYSLGEHKVDAKMEMKVDNYSESEDIKNFRKVSISNFTLTVGLMF